MSDRPIPLSAWARRYCETFNFALVPIQPGEKGPKGRGWNQPGKYIVDPAKAEAFWTKNPNHNLGVVLGPSRVCSLDVDDVQWTRFVLYELLGVDLDALALAFPTVVGNPLRFRVLFQVPEGLELTRHSLSWPNENDPDGSKHKSIMLKANAAREAGDTAREALYRADAEQYKRFTVFELRAGLVQDVLPPSIHPGTGQPYSWRTPPDASGLPVLISDLLNVWNNWDVFKRGAEAACPWLPKDAKPSGKQKPKPKPAPARGKRPSVIDEFNNCHDVEEILRSHGYTKRGGKWLYPQSSTGLPGITVAEGKVYSHHAADPLANGHQNDAFEVFCLLEHGGDQSRAVKEAARMLGMQSTRPSASDLPPAPTEGSDTPHPAAPDAPSEAAPAPDGGAGEELTIEQVLRRFALVEGTTHVWDFDKSRVMKKSAFEARVGKPIAKLWLDATDKKLIGDDQVKDIEQARKMAGKKGGALGMRPTERYVYIDGTKDVWDREKKRRIAEGAVKMALGDTYALWLNSSERRVVDVEHIVFDPTMTKDPSIYINTFDGLPLEPVNDDAACANLRWLISFLCNHDEAAALWLTRWLAYPLQHLGAKMDTAVLMHSTMEGSGKSLLFADTFGALYGQYAATVGQTQLESNFNAWQSRKMWAVFEEVVSRDQRYNQVGKIKHLVTGKTVRMESKFINGWEETNHMNAVFLSNEILPWPISDSDRRMLVMWPMETLPVARQKAIGRELENGGVAALYGWLLRVDLGDFNERTRPPSTASRERLVALSRAGWQTFLYLWRYGELGRGLWGVCLSTDLYALFLEWCQRNKEHVMSQTKFSLFISSEVEKTRSIPWTERNDRRFGAFFVPDDPEASLPPSMRAPDLGVAVDAWRAKARLAGWNVDSWDHVKAVAA
ncbi:bifunctional DNA primase/polymerase [Pseudomonas fragariae (ex Marin et al. 2024)]|uniref:Bifunctional DNA primase/polymerase n=2 Tax=Pseudomonas fragariae (ex Marin et al. 2024) TaxID=3080056 RepID=A0ABT3LQ62_9PSED|nr:MULTISPECIES: bifunctional DNA primase/polymerase [unclassified Pseudomonas]MCW6058258.1 bifunctional DNA primase/polymerase [Pseudomonas fragi]MDV0428353.1 bifunctional DNA primase/polymerase [Pseudomonas sp. 17]MDX9573997.1 bifunctional DNA primase/polymerase [Pseudomonas sp. 21(2023)]MDX9586819.1 bifunctional DNA primase/polymerase [Pseudomonas sp. 19(2023)]MDY6478689.1 bifunctional DNA primase/polymerase [Pseudomonas sp. 18]